MGIPKSAIDKFPPHVQKQINRQLAKKTRLEEIVGEENPEKKSKYSSAKTDVDGIRFDSKKEAEFYAELKLREKLAKFLICDYNQGIYCKRLSSMRASNTEK